MRTASDFGTASPGASCGRRRSTGARSLHPHVDDALARQQPEDVRAGRQDGLSTVDERRLDGAGVLIDVLERLVGVGLEPHQDAPNRLPSIAGTSADGPAAVIRTTSPASASSAQDPVRSAELRRERQLLPEQSLGVRDAERRPEGAVVVGEGSPELGRASTTTAPRSNTILAATAAPARRSTTRRRPGTCASCVSGSRTTPGRRARVRHHAGLEVGRVRPGDLEPGQGPTERSVVHRAGARSCGVLQRAAQPRHRP